jgi:hypothetical protein
VIASILESHDEKTELLR